MNFNRINVLITLSSSEHVINELERLKSAIYKKYPEYKILEFVNKIFDYINESK